MLKIFKSSDREIIRRIKANDREVLGELFIQYKRMVNNYIQSNGGSREDAEDMLQEAIVVVWQKACSEHFELSSKISTFLFAVVKNKWRAALRKRENIDHNLVDEDFTNFPSPSDGEQSRKDRIEIIMKSLKEMDPQCKHLLLLYYFEGRNMEEISTLLKFANVNVVKSKKYQCKKKLETIVKKISSTNGGTL
ncbi:MAG: sigma-70 family RNA polymerase sigma factor [Candidatus Marinimicrobia bacterium]|nr:sigma-70 family RNA polymerase sigma factor [Candidatus Neomarinimicrobiota bacterium]